MVIEQLDPAYTHTAIAAVNDVLHFKGLVGGAAGAVQENWVLVDAAADQGTHWEYTGTRLGTSMPHAFPVGTTFSNYGASGEGIIRFDTEDTYQPFMEVLTHSGRPDTTVVRHTVVGRLQAFTGNDEYGIAVGADLDAFADNWLVLSEDRFALNRDLNVLTTKGFQFDDGGTVDWVLKDDGAGLYTPGAIGAGSVAGLDAQFVLMALSGDLANERVLVGGASLTLTDGGAGGNATLDLDAPGTLTVSTGNAAAAPHTHAITSSSSPGAAASILATDANGDLGVQDLTIAEYLHHEGDANTYLRFIGDQLSFIMGGTTMMELIEGVTDYVYVHAPIIMDEGEWIGRASTDVRIVFDAINGYIDATLSEISGADEFRIVDSGGFAQATLDSDGNADFEGHASIGNQAAYVADQIMNVDEITLKTAAGNVYGVGVLLQAEPGGDTSASYQGMHSVVRLDTARDQIAGQMAGVTGRAEINNGIAGTILEGVGGSFYIDAEDGTIATGSGVQAFTPRVDSGTVTTGHGIWIREGVVGGGATATTLYGLYIDNIDAGSTNWSIYTNGGAHFLGAYSKIQQQDASAAIEVLALQQDDIDKPFINYLGTSAANQTRSISTVNGDGVVEGPKNFSSSAGWAFQGMVRIEINSVEYWMPYYSADTS